MAERPVTCVARGHDRSGRIVAQRQVAAIEINAAMVCRGWAADYAGYRSEQYRVRSTRHAPSAWSGRFEMFWRRRREHLR